MVSVILVNWNTAKHTESCVRSLLLSEYRDLKVNIIDNGSNADDFAVLECLRSENVSIYKLDKNYGYVGGVNHGLRIADKQKPEYILIMNNDTEIDSRSIGELMAAAKRYNNNCIVTGIVYDFYDRDIVQQVGSKCIDKKRLVFKAVCSNKKDPGFVDHDIEMDVIDDVFWLLPLEVFHQVGFYSDDFWFNNEQADYALRAVQAGHKLVFTPRARIWHKGSVSIGGKSSNPIREYFDTKSRIIFRFKHMKKLYFYIFLCKLILTVIFGIVKKSLTIALNKDGMLRVQYARMLGCIYFFTWLLNHKPDTGIHPKCLR